MLEVRVYPLIRVEHAEVLFVWFDSCVFRLELCCFGQRLTTMISTTISGRGLYHRLAVAGLFAISCLQLEIEIMHCCRIFQKITPNIVNV